MKNFNNLKKRVSRIRNKLKEVKRSGAGAADVKKYEDDVRRYGFLSWLIQCTKLKETQSNFQADISDSDEESVYKQSFEEPEDVYDETIRESDEVSDDEDNNSQSQKAAVKRRLDANKHEIPIKTSKISKNAKNNKWKQQKSIEDEEMRTAILKSISENMAARNKQRSVADSPKISNNQQDEFFGKMMAAELAQLSPILKIQFKQEVSQLVYQYQLKEATLIGKTTSSNQSTFQNHAFYTRQDSSGYKAHSYQNQKLSSFQSPTSSSLASPIANQSELENPIYQTLQ